MKKNISIDLIKENVLKNPNSIAFKKQKIEITYKKFWIDLNNFANTILKLKKKPIVAIIGNHEYFDYVCLFGTLASGGTYVPINSDLPYSKINKIISLSKSNIVVEKESKNKIKISNQVSYIQEKDFQYQNNLLNKKIKKFSKIAYIIFTSGSTGEPKGVKISKSNLNYYVKWVVKKLSISKGKKSSQFPGIGFDLSVADIFGTLCKGGTLILPNNYNKIFPGEYIKKEKITHIICVPSLINVISNSNQLNKNYFKYVKKIFFCGEPLYKDHLVKIFKANKKIKIINAYGPTEATVSCTSIDLNFNNYKFYSKYSMAIGKPIIGTKICLLKNGLENKKEGEILISGNQIAEGYINNKAENKKKFILFKGKKSYLTGDIGININKVLYFKERIDNQIKIRGFRVELDEVNYHIRKIGYKNNFSIFYKNKLISFIQGRKINKELIYKKLKKMTQNYMIPSEFISIKKFPLSINGKIDKKILEKFFDEKK